MKKALTIIAVLALLTGAGFAKTNTLSKDKLALAVKSYKIALNSENAGVRNSALYQIAVLKASYPELNLNELDRVLLNVTNKDSVGFIRVNANLTRLLLNDKNLTNAVTVETVDPTEFFSGLYTKLADSYNTNVQE
ncbi:MAG TPA: hypothetical protein PLP19_10220 [bacterium]|nr:hypothetical protein [bacterium]HPN43854.1 hypothetical protein [bacterium]